MYTLYYFPDACSLATQVVLRELGLEFDLYDKRQIDDYEDLNPLGTVPLLMDGSDANKKSFSEGVAILLHLLTKHSNHLLPAEGKARQNAIENMLLANATMHPAYSRLFFISQHLEGNADQAKVYTAAAEGINAIWREVESRLANNDYLGGAHVSPADILLTVYSRWGEFFPVSIEIGPNTKAMIERVMQRESFRLSLQAERDYAMAS